MPFLYVAVKESTAPADTLNSAPANTAAAAMTFLASVDGIALISNFIRMYPQKVDSQTFERCDGVPIARKTNFLCSLSGGLRCNGYAV